MSDWDRAAAGAADSHSGGELTLVALFRFLMRHRRAILATGLVCGALVTGVGLTRSRTYTSTARFMPQTSENSLSRLAGLAASFGVSVPGTEQGSSPAFYAELLKSRDVLRETALTRYAFATKGDSMHGTLVELFRERAPSPALRRDMAARDLLKSIDVTVGHETGTIDLKVSSAWPELSQQIAARMIQLVSDFNLHRRQTKAGAERRFVEARLAESRDSLRTAEGRLQAFLQRNRVYQNSPQLLFEHDRLDRDVNMQQQLYTTLAQSYEAARIDEVRNTPVITVMEAPDLPAKPNARLALLKGLLAGIVGLGLGAFFVALREALGGFRAALRTGTPAGAGTGGGAGRAERGTPVPASPDES